MVWQMTNGDDPRQMMVGKFGPLAHAQAPGFLLACDWEGAAAAPVTFCLSSVTA